MQGGMAISDYLVGHTTGGTVENTVTINTETGRVVSGATPTVEVKNPYGFNRKARRAAAADRRRDARKAAKRAGLTIRGKA